MESRRSRSRHRRSRRRHEHSSKARKSRMSRDKNEKSSTKMRNRRSPENSDMRAYTPVESPVRRRTKQVSSADISEGVVSVSSRQIIEKPIASTSGQSHPEQLGCHGHFVQGSIDGAIPDTNEQSFRRVVCEATRDRISQEEMQNVGCPAPRTAPVANNMLSAGIETNRNIGIPGISIPAGHVGAGGPVDLGALTGEGTSNLSADQGMQNLFSKFSLQDFLAFMNYLRPEQSKVQCDKNIIPEFNPSIKSHRIENWIAKVNECALIYGWSDRQTTYFAMPRLVGHAKEWYESLPTLNYTWPQWQEELKIAFPSDVNYGSLLCDMLDRRLKFTDNLDDYYYEKMILLNACEIAGKKAVDCIIHGLDDRTLRSSATSAQFTRPEQLHRYLKEMCSDSSRDTKVQKNKSSVSSGGNVTCSHCNKSGHHVGQCRQLSMCFNCKQTGHRVMQCPKPLIKCEKCNKYGHKADDCFSNKNNKNEKRVCVAETSAYSQGNSKFYKIAHINCSNQGIACFIDFGSECTLIRENEVANYNLLVERDCIPVIKGIGESRIIPLGKTQMKIVIGNVDASVIAYVVPSHQLHVPLLVGQNFTELPNVLVIKSSTSLEIMNREIPTDLPQIDAEASYVVKLYTHDEVDITGTTRVTCYTPDMTEGDIFVQGSYRCTSSGCEYLIHEGVYKVDKNMCTILVTALLKPLKIKKEVLIVRSELCINQLITEQKEQRCYRAQVDMTPINCADLNINPNLNKEQVGKLSNLLNKYRGTFAENLTELGCTDLMEMNIKLTDTTPVVYRPYRLSYKEREIVQNMVNELIQNDIVEESTSDYASPILLVSKKTGGHRLCIDYRALNSRTVKDHFPLPRIEDQLDRLSGNKYFCALDLTSGYYQIPIKEDCRHLTAFITPDGLFQFKRMPFGLANAPSVFQRTMSKALALAGTNGKLEDKPALAYMDDLIIVSKDFDEGLSKLEATFELLNKANLTLNAQKCNFFQTTIEYLGYEISSEGVRPGKLKIDAVQNFPTPKNVHEVRQFIGLSSYFRKFIKNFSIIARPLTDLTRKECVWKWGSDEINAFNVLKEKLTERPILALYDPKFYTELHTDASKLGLAGILFQKENEEAPLKPVAYYSRKTTPDEQKFHAYDLETLAVVTSLSRFRVYLLGTKFTIVTDCNALRATFSKRDILPRIARWWLTLQEFDCEITYRPNSCMAHVDALSRNPIDGQSTSDSLDCPRVLHISNEDWLLSLQLTDPKLCHIREVLEDNKYSEIVDIKQNFVIRDNKLYRKINENDLKWVVPKGARWQICRQNHDDIGHFSAEKTLSKIKKDFWFPKMTRFVKKYVKSCVSCAYGKAPSGKKEGYLHPITKVDVPFHTVHIDHLGPFVKSTRGNCYLLLLVDGFTKFCFIKPLRNLKSAPTIRALEDIFTTFGSPSRLISDRGTSFTSEEFKKFCEKTHIKHIKNAVASPRSNGQVERYNRTVLGALCANAEKHGENKWDVELGSIQWGLNNTLNKGIGKTPAEVLFGRNLAHSSENIFSDIFENTRTLNQDIKSVRADVSKHIEADQLHQKRRFDQTRKAATTYSVGDLVRVRKQLQNEGQSKKLLPVFSGPYKVTAVLENDRYEVSSIPGSNIGKKHYCNVWAVDQIQPWINAGVNSVSSDSESSN